ncbi:hypothetical protein GCM10010495_60530 [Kitasatospora herbaricolor]|nr:hypothetical protein GCM10010495_60530 [Kitasatospora herbaricolor]
MIRPAPVSQSAVPLTPAVPCHQIVRTPAAPTAIAACTARATAPGGRARPGVPCRAGLAGRVPRVRVGAPIPTSSPSLSLSLSLSLSATLAPQALSSL